MRERCFHGGKGICRDLWGLAWGLRVKRVQFIVNNENDTVNDGAVVGRGKRCAAWRRWVNIGGHALQGLHACTHPHTHTL